MWTRDDEKEDERDARAVAAAVVVVAAGRPPTRHKTSPSRVEISPVIASVWPADAALERSRDRRAAFTSLVVVWPLDDVVVTFKSAVDDDSRRLVHQPIGRRSSHSIKADRARHPKKGCKERPSL